MIHDASNISSLIDAVLQAACSSANEKRKQIIPPGGFGIEEPIAWTLLFDYDANYFFTDAEFYVEQQLRQKLWRWQTFPNDRMPLTAELPAWLGHYPEYTFVGLDVHFNAGGVPVIQTDHPLTRDADLSLLKPVEFTSSGWMPRILRWYEDISSLVSGRLDVPFAMTWWRGCLDLAIQLRGYEQFVADTTENPSFVHGLLDFLVEQRCTWWDGYYRTFGITPGPVVNIADDWINVPFITPTMFDDFILPRYLAIEAYHGGIGSIHSCGNQVPVQKSMLSITSITGMEVSPWSDLKESLVNIPVEKWLSISLHPNDVLLATTDDMRHRLECIKTCCCDRPFSMGTSGLTPLNNEPDDFITRIRTWNKVVSEVFE